MYYLEITDKNIHKFYKTLVVDKIEFGSKVFKVDDSDEDNFIKTEINIKELKQKEAFNNAIETHLNNKAKEFRYDNMMSARSYTGYENAFQAEAQKLAVWASDCWVKAGEIEADVQAGNREMPTIDEVLGELPVYEN